MSPADVSAPAAAPLTAGFPADGFPAAGPEILVAEHEPAVAELTRRYLVKEGMRVRCARTADDTAAALDGCLASAVVLDLTMPGLDARQIRRLIHARPVPPVICLTAGGRAHGAQGLRPRDIGVSQDACLPRPFGPRALVAKVREAARAARGPAAPGCTVGGLHLEPAGRRAWQRGTEIFLTGTEFDVLACLARSAGRTLSRERLRQVVWGTSGTSADRIVDVYITQLRAKLGPASGIRTVRGVGYVLDGPAGSAGRPPGPAAAAQHSQTGR